MREIVVTERLRRNAWGRYYVSGECDGCGVCADCAPENFASSPDGSCYYLVQQPRNDAQEGAVRWAMAACPLGCIQDDGDTDD